MRQASISTLLEPVAPTTDARPGITKMASGQSGMDSWHWESEAARKIGGASEQARLYLKMMDESDYAECLAPVVGPLGGTVLDLGAGAGSLTRHCLVPGAHWLAVEPNQEMGRALGGLRENLSGRGIQVDWIPSYWEDLDRENRLRGLKADYAVAFNMGATHHAADRLYDTMSTSLPETMIWVVPAQEAPSSFCLAGYLPEEFWGETCVPAYRKTLEQLGASRQPDRIEFVDWTCRLNFSSRNTLLDHFLDRLDLSRKPSTVEKLRSALVHKLDCEKTGNVVSCPKRSAVMFWYRSSLV